MKALSLEELRQLVRVHMPREVWMCRGVEGGIPQGALTAVTGSGKTEFVVHFLRQHPELKVAWVEDQMTVFPFGLSQQDLAMERILFVEAGKDLAWAVLQVLKSQTFQVVVVYAKHFELAFARKMQLASEKSGASTFLLAAEMLPLYPISLQIKISRQGSVLQSQILKRRF